MRHFGEKVYFRYNPNDLKEVRIYNLEDKYLMTVPVDNTAVLTYGATKDDVKAGMAVTRKLEKIANEYKKNVVIAEADRLPRWIWYFARHNATKKATQAKQTRRYWRFSGQMKHRYIRKWSAESILTQ